jgi:hypothetical protein
MGNVTKISESRSIGRPLKTLIPMIQSELQQGNEAGQEHYQRAGQMLIEAKDQVSHGQWGPWLTKNFELSQPQARLYMQWARHHEQNAAGGRTYSSMREMRGATERDREQRKSQQQKDFRRVLRDVAADTFIQERQARDAEVQLHRELAEELVDLGYRALATKLHPDRGGTQNAMVRLNRVRDELKAIAQQRRFV